MHAESRVRLLHVLKLRGGKDSAVVPIQTGHHSGDIFDREIPAGRTGDRRVVSPIEPAAAARELIAEGVRVSLGTVGRRLAIHAKHADGLEDLFLHELDVGCRQALSVVRDSFDARKEDAKNGEVVIAVAESLVIRIDRIGRMVALTAGILSAAGAMEAREIRIQPQPQPRQSQPRQTNNASPENRMRHATNSRPGGVHINPDYFASHYGNAHALHFSDDPFRQIGGELYFNFNGGWFGVMGPVPGNWGLQANYFYIGLGGDGNYYLYDAQFPDMAVQLTFVQNPRRRPSR